MYIERHHCTLLLCLVLALGCQGQNDIAKTGVGQGDISDPASGSLSIQNTSFTDRVVEASCGECQFGMDGSGCDLAIRIEGESYYVDGAMIDDHGDAHAADGMCNSVRQAKVSGEIRNGRFVSTSFELLPFDENQSP